MSILTNELIRDFLGTLEAGKIPSVYNHLDSKVAKAVLIRFGSSTAFIDMMNKYFETNKLDGLSDFFLFGTHGIMFVQQNKEDLTNFLNDIKITADSQSILEYMMGDIQTMTDKTINLDDLAQAWIAPVHVNPHALDMENPSDYTLVAMSEWILRTSVLWTFYAYRDFIKSCEMVAQNQAAIKSFIA